MTDTPDRDTIMRDYITRILGFKPQLNSVHSDDDTWHWNTRIASPTRGYDVTLERANCAIHVNYSDDLTDIRMDQLKTVIGHAIVEKVALFTPARNLQAVPD